jgi:hypothetical protein
MWAPAHNNIYPAPVTLSSWSRFSLPDAVAPEPHRRRHRRGGSGGASASPASGQRLPLRTFDYGHDCSWLCFMDALSGFLEFDIVSCWYPLFRIFIGDNWLFLFVKKLRVFIPFYLCFIKFWWGFVILKTCSPEQIHMLFTFAYIFDLDYFLVISLKWKFS